MRGRTEINMKTSTEINSAAKYVGEERAIELVAKAGFDAWDFSMFKMVNYDWPNKRLLPCDHPLASNDYQSFAKKLRKIGEDCGIHCNQSHAPFPTYHKGIQDYMKRAIECTAIAGGEICIVHPMNLNPFEENLEMYYELLPFAKEHGVKIATENMWDWNNERDEASYSACSHHDEFKKYIETVNDPYFVACLDLGHAEMKGLGTTAVEMIRALGATGGLAALHVHDNDRWHDSHQIPYSMDMDFGAITKALREVGYKGYCTLEADAYLAAYKDDLFTGIQNLQKAARRFCDDFEAK